MGTVQSSQTTRTRHDRTHCAGPLFALMRTFLVVSEVFEEIEVVNGGGVGDGMDRSFNGGGPPLPPLTKLIIVVVGGGDGLDVVDEVGVAVQNAMVAEVVAVKPSGHMARHVFGPPRTASFSPNAQDCWAGVAVVNVTPAAGVEQVEVTMVSAGLSVGVITYVEQAVGTLVFQQPPVTIVSPLATNCSGT